MFPKGVLVVVLNSHRRETPGNAIKKEALGKPDIHGSPGTGWRERARRAVLCCAVLCASSDLRPFTYRNPILLIDWNSVPVIGTVPPADAPVEVDCVFV
jgi:hypothetical protein